MNLLSITKAKRGSQGKKELDLNKVVELLTKLAVIGTILATAYSAKKSGNNATALRYLGGSNVVETAVKEAASAAKTKVEEKQ